LICNDAVVERVSEPLVPLIVSVYVPLSFDVALVLTVSEEEEAVAATVTGFGLKPAVAPDGRPTTERETDPSNPFAGVTVMAYFALAPRIPVHFDGEALIEKSALIRDGQRDRVETGRGVGVRGALCRGAGAVAEVPQPLGRRSERPIGERDRERRGARRRGRAEVGPRRRERDWKWIEVVPVARGLSVARDHD
jgi:hypothetical protein